MSNIIDTLSGQINTPAGHKRDGGRAFPRAGSSITSEDHDDGDVGMSLRDWFAGQAMIGFISNSDIPDLLRGGFKPDGAADACYMIADAMLKARQS